MFCPNCNHALYDDCNFCHNCGAKAPNAPKEEPDPEPEASDATVLFAFLAVFTICVYFLYACGFIQ